MRNPKTVVGLLCLLVGLLAGARAQAAVTRAEFDRVLRESRAILAPIAESGGEELAVFGVWAEDWVNANAKRWPPDFIITIYGGLAREPQMTPDALALVVCHEFGHGYGGPPYRDSYNRISVEGQADFWGGGPCAEVLLGSLAGSREGPEEEPEVELDEEEERFIGQVCSGAPICERTLRGARALIGTLAHLHGEAPPRLDGRDPVTVPATELGHPRTYQCRLDTWVAAVLKGPRPACWFRDESVISSSR